MNAFITMEQEFLLEILKFNRMNEDLRNKIDWEILFNLLNENQLLPFFYKHYSDVIPEKFKIKYYKNWEEHNKITKVRINEVMKVAKMINENNLSALIHKGIILSQLVHNDISIRKSYDIDILIDEKDVNRMHDLLLENGYIHGCGIHDPYDTSEGIMKLERPVMKAHKHHEYFEYYYEYDQGKYIELELQKSVHGTITEREKMSKFLNSWRIININGMDIKTLDNEHMIIHLLESLYTDSEWFYRGPRLNKYYDVFVLISNQDLNWDRLIQLAQEYNIIEILYYTLNLTNQIFDTGINESIMKKFNFPISKPFSIEWKDSITSRLFSKNEDRVEELQRYLKTVCYGDKNYYWKHPIIINEQGHDLIHSNIQLNDFKYNFDTKYRIYMDHSTLFFIFHLDSRMMASLDRFEIVIDFFDPDFSKNELIFETINLNLIDRTYMLRDRIIRDAKSSTGEEFIVSIPKNALKSLNNKLVFVVGLQEKMLHHFYHLLSPNFYYDKDLWFKMPVMQLS
ncbi:nucleotidyltransferase family protein [Paenibacillus taiwanensis]|uniref:nucleotidyltransferase family protein n=1 Tax=Paenibacillus taiwanensis TaxID=401638 RepID=UPI00040876FF|nr:nucleotidyltransferase family protein [Paenibacillus taiwanensis]